MFAIMLALASMTVHAADRECGLRPADGERLRNLVQNLVERGHAPGVVIDVRCDGRPWLQAAVGLSDVARSRPMQLDSLFRIYSMTKPLTSLLVMMLAEEGRLSIDDPVARYLPEFSMATVHNGSAMFPPETVPPQRPVTVRDLLRHTAGLTYISAQPDPVSRMYVQRGIDHGGGNQIVPADGGPAIESLADLSQRIAAIPMLAQPGSRYSYGSATDVLGRMVEVVMGRRLRDAMAEKLLKPLAMQDTSFQPAPEQLNRLTASYLAPALAPRGTGLFFRVDMKTVAPSSFSLADDPAHSVFAARRVADFGGAGLVSTAADYQRFLWMMLRRGEVDGVRLVRRDTVAAMTHNQIDAPALRDTILEQSGMGFGLGFATFESPEGAPAALPLDGYFWGGAASTYFWVDPGRGITGVLMTQVFGGDVGPYFAELLDTLYRPPPKFKTQPLPTSY
ncbi:serine hydrolase domain-containing protein [Roseateles sp.]|uniref:serine hydrolase domain-containing protein n=1 Tax=Roseateles sp. TaxID=1971397 RepID=UPI0037CBF852